MVGDNGEEGTEKERQAGSDEEEEYETGFNCGSHEVPSDLVTVRTTTIGFSMTTNLAKGSTRQFQEGGGGGGY